MKSTATIQETATTREEMQATYAAFVLGKSHGKRGHRMASFKLDEMEVSARMAYLSGLSVGRGLATDSPLVDGCGYIRRDALALA